MFSILLLRRCLEHKHMQSTDVKHQWSLVSNKQIKCTYSVWIERSDGNVGRNAMRLFSRYLDNIK